MRYQSNRPKRQFLASVRCPACQALDSVVLVRHGDDEYIECISCLHSETRPKATADPKTDDHLASPTSVIVPIRFVP